MATQVGAAQGGEHGRAMRDRFLFAMLSLMGSSVEVHVRSGVVYEGIFMAATSGADLEVLLSVPRVKRQPEGSSVDAVDARNILRVRASDLVQVFAASVDLNDRAMARQGFQTDTDISAGGANLEGRSLEAVDSSWLEGAEGVDAALLEGLDSGGGGGGGGRGRGGRGGGKGIGNYDQFAYNEEKFGVKSTFDMEDYSTKLDKTRLSRQQQSRADRLAREIQTADSGGNMHMAEERGQAVNVNGEVDEETLYSSVARKGASAGSLPPGLGTYRPPMMRGRSAPAEGDEAAPMRVNAAGASREDTLEDLKAFSRQLKEGGDAPAPAAAAPAPAPAPAAAAEAKKPATKLNPKAKEFKFNPKAASFVPGGGAAPAVPAAPTPAQIAAQQIAQAQQMALMMGIAPGTMSDMDLLALMQQQQAGLLQQQMGMMGGPGAPMGMPMPGFPDPSQMSPQLRAQMAQQYAAMTHFAAMQRAQAQQPPPPQPPMPPSSSE